MKIKILLITLIVLCNTSITFVSANESDLGNEKLNTKNIKKIDITRGDIFNFFANYYNDQIPSSYKYINVNYKDVKKGSELEKSLKKLIYLDLIKNPNRSIQKDSNLNAYSFFRLSEKILKIKINDAESKENLQNRNTEPKDILAVSKFVNNPKASLKPVSTKQTIKQKLAIFQNVYDTIINGHYDKNNLDESKILNSAISGIAKGTGDRHTVYFPPVESESFNDSLSGEYEGIGSYVDMEEPGVLKILSPIPGSPSEKSGLKGGDIITKVDGKEIKKENSLKEVITWIKGPAGTKVVLTIKRKGKTFEIEVTREKITITDIEGKIINRNTYYLQIKSFGDNVSKDFKESIAVLNNNNKINKIIIDVRNNGGGYLTEVAEILSYFVEKGKTTAQVKYRNKNKNFISRGYDFVDFSKYKIVVLQNSGTASASEILIGTLKDYYPNIELIGENTYGKGSVQVMKGYSDGSLLKYTIAKWFTGLTSTGIDGVGIKPTIELELDIEKYKKDGYDNQLNRAKLVR